MLSEWIDTGDMYQQKGEYFIKQERADDMIKELQNFVKNKIARYKYPREIEFVQELPKTATGKIQRFKLRSQNKKTARFF